MAKTETTKHTPKAKTCGCSLEPTDDERQESDLCSEATGSNDSRGWVIVYCPTHAAASEMADALRDVLGPDYGAPCRDCGQVGMHPIDPETGLSCRGRAKQRARALLRRIE